MVISASSVKKTLISTITLVVVLHVIALILFRGFGYDYAKGFVPMFNMHLEANFPTFVAMLFLLSAGMLCFLSPGLDKTGKPSRASWYLLGVIFVFLAADEIFLYHEVLSGLLPTLIQADWVPRFAWVVVYAPLTLVLAVVMLPWFLRFDLRSQVLLVIAATCFLGGALGAELIASEYLDAYAAEHGIVGRIDDKPMLFVLLSTIEETLEFIGVAVFIYALVQRFDEISISASSAPRQSILS